MGKNKLARWNEFGSFDNVIQPEIGDVSAKDHAIKGKWNKELFKNENPIVLELGCGKGEYTVGLATRFREKNYIGIDIKGARMWRGAKTANEQKLPNVAFLRTRIEFINSFFSTDEVDEIWVTFPDPHPGGKNSNKRLTSPWFLNGYRQFLKNNGLVHLKTDNTELFRFTKTVVEYNNLELMFATSDLYSENLSDDILSIRTHYEKMFLNKGMKINYITFRLEKEKNIENALQKQKGNNDFFSKVYAVTKLVPYGRITSYGAIARYLGSGRSARMVGWALNSSHSNQDFIPAHRVVNRNGLLTGKHHFGNSTTMEQLLENEGIIIEDDRIINFSEKFWDPMTELL